MIPLLAFMAAAPLIAPSDDVASYRWEKRVLIVSAPDPNDALLTVQRRILAKWKSGSSERDLVVVEVFGTEVVGATNTAASIRRRYGLPSAGLTALIIGKDGGVKLRESRTIPAEILEATIDAMPMRRDEVRQSPPGK